MKKLVTLVSLTVFCIQLSSAQTTIKWDDTQSKNWPSACKKVEITSTLDSKIQKAYFFESTGAEARPLVVSLHTWSGGYEQKDTLAWICIQKNYNYIHPDFRGPNNNPEACGSKFAISDIDDAIAFALKHARVDTSEIHVVGVSGGGYASLLSYMNTVHPVRSFSAWVPISNLVDWYYESVGRAQKYAKDIAQATTGTVFNNDNYYMNEEQARSRSPFYMETPVEKRKQSKLFIYTGIHDGYLGSVPITQSLKFYNKLVKDYSPGNSEALIKTEEMLELVESQNSRKTNPAQIKPGVIHFQKNYKDLIQVNVFEGKHEMIAERALLPVENKKILAVGDSNGAIDIGWVNQLKEIRFNDFIYNTCISGNTIGFDNGWKALNTLRNIDQYLEKASEKLGRIDKIVIMLGTNDCKAIYDDSLKLVPENFEKLLTKIKAHPAFRQFKPELYFISPPPYASKEKLIEKYWGGSEDLEWLFPRFQKVAKENEVHFIDTYHRLIPLWDYLSSDGIHLNIEGQKILAQMISEGIE